VFEWKDNAWMGLWYKDNDSEALVFHQYCSRGIRDTLARSLNLFDATEKEDRRLRVLNL
jgi:hypothetical protein